MKHYLRVVMRTERLNQSYMQNVMRSNPDHWVTK